MCVFAFVCVKTKDKDGVFACRAFSSAIGVEVVKKVDQSVQMTPPLTEVHHSKAACRRRGLQII